jgi:hypothetical protein
LDETEIFAGASCEYKATSLCASPTDRSTGNVHFCTNGGECPINNLMMPCECSTAWQGFHCEFAVDPEELPGFHDDIENDDGLQCNLPCENGGVCANGAKDFGSLHDSFSDVSHLNQTFDNEYFAHCVCPEGFVGLTCKHKIEVCGDEDHVCLHGSTCVEHDNGKHTCDCSRADEAIGSTDKVIFAGDSCQYTGTDICTIGEEYPGKPLYFCVNDGTCNAKVTADQEDPGCSCPNKYTGPHCEERLHSNTLSTNDISSENTILITGVTVTAVVVCVAVAMMGVRILRIRSNCLPVELSVKGIGTPFPRRRRRKAGYGGSNLAPPNRSTSDAASSERFSSSDPVASGFALPPDEEPGPGDVDGIMKDTVDDEQSFVDVGPPQDVDVNHLDNVDFV